MISSLCAIVLLASPAEPADLVIVNAHVFTADDARPEARAGAVKASASSPWEATPTCARSRARGRA